MVREDRLKQARKEVKAHKACGDTGISNESKKRKWAATATVWTFPCESPNPVRSASRTNRVTRSTLLGTGQARKLCLILFISPKTRNGSPCVGRDQTLSNFRSSFAREK